MPAPPPPPPPLPPMLSANGPPPPPMPGGSSLPARPTKAASQGRGALLSDLSKGDGIKKGLRKAQTNDRSAPIVGKELGGSSGPIPGAPSIPVGKGPSSLAPPVPLAGTANRLRSSSDVASPSNDMGGVDNAPQLGGLFAGGIPKLKKRSGGVDTGAGGAGDASYSDSETSRPAVSRPPANSAPRPPALPAPSTLASVLPKANGLRPSPVSSESSPPFAVHNLKKVPPKPGSKPSSASLTIGKLPPPPPTGLRKASLQPSLKPPPLPSSAPSIPSALPQPLSSSSSPAPASIPPAPPLPSSAAPSIAPPLRSTPPTPPPLPPPSAPSTNGPSNGSPSPAAPAAMMAAVSVFSNKQSSSPLSQPPQAASSPSPSSPSAPSFNRPSVAQMASRSNLDASSYTLTNGGSSFSSSGRNSGASLQIEDRRWKFQDESQLPPPRQFTGVAKRYRAGRGSSVPLNLESIG